MTLSFAAWTRAMVDRTERALDAALPAESETPARLHRAMRYACMNGGKRVRPWLVYAGAEVGEGALEAADLAAVAVELIHAYSLVHDDMPEMDDDALRRGRPTVHVAFDQATALLVGDALQTLAFEVLSAPGTPLSARMVSELARAAGSRGMAGGQAIDLNSVGTKLDREALEQMHSMKTGALLNASARLGALCAGLDHPAALEAIDRYASAVGLAFQVVDDILDTEGDTATLGKTAGKDAAADKPTFVSILGVEASKRLAHDLRDRALDALQAIDRNTMRLREIAEFVVARSH